MAARDNGAIAEMDKTAFWVTGLCAICHPGGGITEFDRDGEKYYDVTKPDGEKWGYEPGLMAAPAFSGDYTEVTGNGTSAKPTGIRDAPWDKTGLSEPDCLSCHRADRATAPMAMGYASMNWIWRGATLRRKDLLVDSAAADVPAYAGAATAGQGWHDTATFGANMIPQPAGKPPMAGTLDIDYGVGVTDGSLIQDPDTMELRVNGANITAKPADSACWACHATADLKKRGRAWFDPAKDVHYAFYGSSSADPIVARQESKACTVCHPLSGAKGMPGSDREHDIAKGNATLGSARDDTDWIGLTPPTGAKLQTCRDCHTATGPGPVPASAIHALPSHLGKLACEVCHIPFKYDPADILVDNATTGSTNSATGGAGYKTTDFYSNDPLLPGAARPPGNTEWWPDFTWKKDRIEGGIEVWRVFPVKRLHSMWWGDWIDDGDSLPDAGDQIRPLPLWKVRHATNGAVPAGVIDDSGDGFPEVNTLGEIALYITPGTGLLVGDDGTGTPAALNPVLVKGGQVFYWNGAAVASVPYGGASGVHTESTHPFSVSHNVLPASLALGAGGGAACDSACHDNTGNSQFFDRRVLVDPFDAATGAAVYDTVQNLLNADPNKQEDLTP